MIETTPGLKEWEHAKAKSKRSVHVGTWDATYSIDSYHFLIEVYAETEQRRAAGA